MQITNKAKIVAIASNYRTQPERLGIPGTERKLFPPSEERTKDGSFSFGGVMTILSGRMDHTLGLFFKGYDEITAEFRKNFGGGQGEEIHFATTDGKPLLTVHLAGLSIYTEPNSSTATNEAMRRAIPHYTGRLMYDFEKDVLRGGASFGLLTAIAKPFDDPKVNGHEVPEFFKRLIFTRHI
jgi:hypothetical protein